YDAKSLVVVSEMLTAWLVAVATDTGTPAPDRSAFPPVSIAPEAIVVGRTMAMSSAATTSPSVDKVDGFSRKSVRKAKQKRSQSSSQFRSQGKPIELTPLPLLK
ncbi:hypothetical protein NHX12_000041, partial [Muraenolepis orangiensis]